MRDAVTEKLKILRVGMSPSHGNFSRELLMNISLHDTFPEPEEVDTSWYGETQEIYDEIVAFSIAAMRNEKMSMDLDTFSVEDLIELS
eukprot:gene4823-15117_t